MRWLCVTWLLLFAVSCVPSSTLPEDAGVPRDAASFSDSGDGDSGDGDSGDSGNDDGGNVDAGSPPLDSGELDAGELWPRPGFGDISGPCDVLSQQELFEAAPSFFLNALDFGADPYDDGDNALLSEGGQYIVDAGNAGGSSLFSEVFAYEVLERCEGAVLLKTETQIEYFDNQGKITDLLVNIDNVVIGVSVTRAVAFPFDDPYSVEQAQAILEQKLLGVLDSSANVKPEDAWQKQILSVIAYSPAHGDALLAAFPLIADDIKADTIVYVTVSNGDDAFLY